MLNEVGGREGSGNLKDTGATSTGPRTLGIIGKEGVSTVGVDKIGAGDVAGMETIAERGGAQAGTLYVSVKEEWVPDGFEVTSYYSHIRSTHQDT